MVVEFAGIELGAEAGTEVSVTPLRLAEYEGELMLGWTLGKVLIDERLETVLVMALVLRFRAAGKLSSEAATVIIF